MRAEQRAPLLPLYLGHAGARASGHVCRREVDDRPQVRRPPPALPVEAEKFPKGILSRLRRHRGKRSHCRRHLLHLEAANRLNRKQNSKLGIR